MSIIQAAGSGEVGSSGFYSYSIDQSLRFDSARSTVLTRTATTPTNGKKATWSWWMKKSDVVSDTSGSYKSVFYSGSPNNNGFAIAFMRYGTSRHHELIVKQDNGSSSAYMFLLTDAFYRDVAGWYHFVVRYDSTDSTANDRIKIYVNGTEQTINRTGTDIEPPLNHIPSFQVSGQTLRIGEGRPDVNEHINAYLAELHFVDGQALDPSSFGETVDGIWVAKEYSGSHGDNGFYLTFQAIGTGTTAQGTTAQTNIGDDQSGEGHNFAVSALVASDVVPDSPTNNFATFNPLLFNANVYSEGNLKNASAGNDWEIQVATMFPAGISGKWYAEFYVHTCNASGTRVGVGVTDANVNPENYLGQASPDVAYYDINDIYTGGSKTADSNLTFAAGDIISVALNLEDGEVTFRKNNSTMTNGTQNLIANTLYTFASTNYGSGSGVVANFGQDSSFAGAKTSGSANAADGNGVGDFYYAPPSGFLAIASSNLPEPTIIDGTEYFNTVLYTGDASSSKAISGVGFSPDWLWIKERSSGSSHVLMDSVRGASKFLVSENTNAEQTATSIHQSFDADGFTVGNSGAVNQASQTYVAWNWLAGTAFSNSAGASGATIASSGQANATAGFSIVKYTGNGATGATVAHGLSSALQFYIIKNRDATFSWTGYQEALGAGKYLQLDSSSAASSTSDWNSTAPTSSVFTVSGDEGRINKNGTDYIAYCFHSVEGYSKVGSYTGNGNADGAFVFTGFRPAWVLFRSSGVGHWIIFDDVRHPSNVNDLRIYANLSNAEDSSYSVDLLSNGFKPRHTGSDFNSSGVNYTYLAFADQPFKFSNAR